MELTPTTTGNGTCNAVTDQVQIAFTPAPVVNAGADGAVCANNAAIALNGSVTGATGGTWSGGTGTFSPNANTLNAELHAQCRGDHRRQRDADLDLGR